MKPRIRLLLVIGMAVAMLAVILWVGLILSASPVSADEGTAVDDGAVVDEGTPTDKGTAVDDGAVVDEGTPTDEGTPVDDGAIVNEGTPIDEDTAVDDGAVVDEGTPTDEDTPVDDGAIVNEGTPIDEDTAVDDGAVVDETAIVDGTSGQTQTTEAIVQTDLTDYLPTDTPVITGAGFDANSEVTVTVIAPDGTTTIFATTTDVEGQFTTTYTGPMGDGTFSVTATDGSSTAGTTFEDAFGIVWVKSSNSPTWDGEDDSFQLTDDVYAYIKTGGGTGTAIVRIYVTSNAQWDAGDDGTALTDVSGGWETQTLTATTSGQEFGPYLIWSATTTAGSYDIVVDVDNDGVYDHPSNALDKVDNSGTPAGFTVNKADAVIVVTPYNVTYDGNPHTATGTATGVNSEDLSGLLDLSGTTHTNAGDYPSDPWTFAGNTNYNADSGTVHDIIGKADAVIVVTPYNVTYDGNPHTATGTATGVESPTPADLSGLLDLSGTTHTNAGDYPSDPWTFAGNTNYNADSGTVHDIISTAAPGTLGVAPAPRELVLVIDWFGVWHYYRVTAAGVLLEDVNLTSPDGNTTLVIPVGTLVLDADEQPLYLHRDPDMIVATAGTPLAPLGATFVAVYEMLPDGTTFKYEEAQLIVAYDPATVTPGSVLVIAYYDEETGEWVEIEMAGYVAGGDTASNTVTGYFTHFTYIALLAKLPAE